MSPTSLIVTDFNNDGDLDLVVASGTPDYLFPDFGSGNLYLFLGNGDGTFQGLPLLPTGQSPWSLTINDVNGDASRISLSPMHSPITCRFFWVKATGRFRLSRFTA